MSVLDLLERCERGCSPRTPLYFHAEGCPKAEPLPEPERQPRDQQVPCGFCRRMTIELDRFCSHNCRDLAAAAEERARKIRGLT